jgi:hypothetical protein
LLLLELPLLLLLLATAYQDLEYWSEDAATATTGLWVMVIAIWAAAAAAAAELLDKHEFMISSC